MSNKILFVDDDSNILKMLERTLRNQREIWEMYFVGSVDEALDLLQSVDIDVVISDISMPKRDGFDLLSTIRNTEHTCDIPVLILTGLNARDLKRKSLDLGATDLLNKPTDREDLVARINSMLRIKLYQDEIKRQNEHLEQRVQARTSELEAARLDLIWCLGKAAEYRDTDTGNHIIRVGYYCKILSECMNTDISFTEMIFLTSPLHDIGKIGIPDNVLLKPGKLDSDEWETMKTHCRIGADILKQDSMRWNLFKNYNDQAVLKLLKKFDNPFMQMASNIALCHHEKWNGQGYPDGLSHSEIPLEARIVAIADVYDALFSARPYKEAFSEKEVMEIMRDSNSKHFDPELYYCFENSLDCFNEIRTKFSD